MTLHTLQHQSDRIAALLQLAKSTLTPPEFDIFTRGFSMVDRIIGGHYAPKVRNLILRVLLIKSEIELNAQADPDSLRRQLILDLLDKGPQDILFTFAMKNMFNDVDLSRWTSEYDLAFLLWSKDIPGGSVDFIRFEKAYHEN